MTFQGQSGGMDMRKGSRQFVAMACLLALAGLAQAQSLGGAGEGRRLWLKLNCSGCHGDRAAGGMGPNVAHAEAGDLSEAVLQGEEGGMRSYRTYVTKTDLTNLALYLRSIGTVSEPKFRDWWVAVPTK